MPLCESFLRRSMPRRGIVVGRQQSHQFILIGQLTFELGHHGQQLLYRCIFPFQSFGFLLDFDHHVRTVPTVRCLQSSTGP